MISEGPGISGCTESDWWRPLGLNSANMRKAVGEINRECLRIPRSAVPPNCRMALDIGGSLAKVAYIVQGKDNLHGDENEALVHLVTFDLEQLEGCLSFIKETVNGWNDLDLAVKATGVGCMKYNDRLLETLGASIPGDDKEMQHALRGLDVLWQHMRPEDLLHEQSDSTGLEFRRSLLDSRMGPFILVNLGSAMTVVLVDECGVIKGIVGGSTFAGLSFLGLGVMLTQAESFKDLVELAEGGDHRNVDLLVRDTAGTGYFSNPADCMVSSFGKAARVKGKKGFRDEDIASSILYAITDNLATQTYLVAQCQNVARVVFCGTYLNGNPLIRSQISEKFTTMAMFLKCDIKPIFMRYESYLGVLGVLFHELPISPLMHCTATTNGDHS